MGKSKRLNAPYFQPDAGFDVTFSDTDDLTENPAILFIGVGGTLEVETASGNTLTFLNVQDGSWFPILVKKVLTGTTCSGVVAVYNS